MSDRVGKEKASGGASHRGPEATFLPQPSRSTWRSKQHRKVIRHAAFGVLAIYPLLAAHRGSAATSLYACGAECQVRVGKGCRNPGTGSKNHLGRGCAGLPQRCFGTRKPPPGPRLAIPEPLFPTLGCGRVEISLPMGFAACLTSRRIRPHLLISSGGERPGPATSGREAERGDGPPLGP